MEYHSGGGINYTPNPQKASSTAAPFGNILLFVKTSGGPLLALLPHTMQRPVDGFKGSLSIEQWEEDIELSL